MEEKVKVSCSRCGATNNYPLGQEGHRVVCGRCHSPLPVPGTVLEPSLEEVRVLLQEGRLPVLIDFYSDSCAPCRAMHSTLERLASRRKGELMTIRVSVDANPGLASSFGVQAVPTFVILSRGTERGRTSGFMSEADFSLWVASKA
jgi:thioredoxin 2